MAGNLNEALFDTGYDKNVVTYSIHENDLIEAWKLPKFKVPQYGGNFFRVSSTAYSCCYKYKIPQNCNKMGPPRINPEIWGELNKWVQSADKEF